MTRYLPRSVFGLVVAASLVLGLSTLVLGVVVYSVSHEALEQQLDQRIETESHALLALLEHAGTAGLAAEIIRREDRRGPNGMGYLLVDADGRRVAGRLNAPVPGPGWQEFLYSTDGSGERSASQALTTALPDGGRLVVAADRTPVDEIDSTILALFISAFGAMLVVGIGSAWDLALSFDIAWTASTRPHTRSLLVISAAGFRATAATTSSISSPTRSIECSTAMPSSLKICSRSRATSHTIYVRLSADCSSRWTWRC